MNTAIVWLLINIGSGAAVGQQTSVIATFDDQTECTRVSQSILRAAKPRGELPPIIRCIEARIVVR